METPESPTNTADVSVELAFETYCLALEAVTGLPLKRVLAMGDGVEATSLAKQWLFASDGHTPATMTYAAVILLNAMVATLLEKLTVTPNDPTTS
jgi:hypothetical protein